MYIDMTSKAVDIDPYWEDVGNPRDRAGYL
jgi:hypothetical protein